MDGPTEVLLFGDQTSNFEESLQRLLHIKSNNALLSFFERTHYALRIEIAKLRDRERSLFPRFTSLGDLVARFNESGGNPSLESALSVINQFGRFIYRYSNGSTWCPSSPRRVVVGMCTGLLTATAVSCAQTVDQLIPLAVEVVLIAFRTGVRTMQVGEGIQRSPALSPSWSFLVPSLQKGVAARTLATFCQKKNIPISSQPWISASSASSLTISGPPSVLELLFATPEFTSFKPLSLPVHAPYHASHLYGESDIDLIIGGTAAGILSSYTPNLPLISSVTGELLVSANLYTLLRSVLSEILISPIYWDKVITGCNSLLNVPDADRCRIIPFASNSSQSLATALTATLVLESELDDETSKTAFTSGMPSGRHEHSKIAIIGYSGRFPDAANAELFWDLLHQGRDVHKKVPPDRFDVNTHYDPTGKKKNTSQTPYGCFINEPGLFDARFFHMSPKEAAQADPAQRLALLTAYEALEMSGFVPDRTPSTQKDRVGIFYGLTSDDWREVNSGQNVGTYFIPGGNRAFTPGRINYHFKFSGPSVSVDTACSSSLAAIHMACNSLWRNDCDMALAGGTNILTNPDNFCGLDKGHFLSRTGNCKTFDDEADGYCRADGVGTIVLKRLEDAQADDDPVYGVIAGAYTNHSAEADSITRPHVGAQAFIFKKVLNDAGVDPLKVGYIEMHGTGTQAGDAVEMKSVLDVFTSGRSQRNSRYPLYLGSAKSNIGHGESASGVTSLIKVLLMMKKNEIPPHCGIKGKINRNFPTDLHERGIRIATEPIAWHPPKEGLRRVFLNNFSAAGGNTALLLEDAPCSVQNNRNATTQDLRSSHVVLVSARSGSALTRNIQALAAFIKHEMGSGLSLADLSYTTTARRMHHNYRTAVSGSNLTIIKEKLEEAALQDGRRPVPALTPSIVFAFTGQGSMYAGVGKQLYTIPSFRNDMDYFDRIGGTMGFPTIKPFIDGTVDEIKTLTPLVVQLGLTCLQISLARLWIAWGIKPSAVVGHSLGEYAALYVAGVLSASDAIYLVGRRAQLLEEKCSLGTHSMLAVKTSLSYLKTIANSEHFEIACINAPDQTVICGLSSDIDKILRKLTDLGIKCTKLAVAFAFHSSQVEPILPDFEIAAGGITFHKPLIPVISPTLAAVATDGTIDNQYLGRQCRGTVDLVGAIQAAQATGTITTSSLWVEIGPDPIVCGMIRAILGQEAHTIASLRRREDTWKVFAEALSAFYLAGIDIQWNEYQRDFNTNPKTIQLPAYQWDYQNHWIQYVHDWCLTKGEAPSPQITKIPTPEISTTTVQRLISEQNEEHKSTVVVESDLSNPQLNAIFQAHKVNGTALCPSSVYADIALTLGKYILKSGPSNMDSGMEICHMVVDKPLIAKAQGDPLVFRASVTVNWVTQSALVTYFSVTCEGKKISDHATCTIRYGNPDKWLEEWKRNAYLIKSRMEKLLKDAHNGESQRIKRRMVYKLFSSFVEYDQKFQGMKEVILDSDEYEATAFVGFQTTDHDGTFHTSPYWIDSLGHLSGFVMNGNDALDSNNGVFINHGWDSMRCVKDLSATAVYQTYVKMQPIGENLFSGDVYMFEGDTIIGVNQGVTFQGVPRRFLNMLLPPAGPSPMHSQSTAPQRAPASQTPRPKGVSAPRTRPLATQNQAQSVAAPKPTETSVFTAALSIIADETGIALRDLTENSVFADLGVDSLLSLTISGRIREETCIDVESSIFVDCPTVADLRKRLEGNPLEPSQPQELLPTPPSSPDSGSTADSESTHGDGSETSIEEFNDSTSLIASVLAEEMGFPLEEILEAADLGELGLDSLVSLTVLGRLRETGMDLPLDYFSKNISFVREQSKSGPKGQPKIETSISTQTTSISPRPEKAVTLPATSILLQRSTKEPSKTLFLFPDGSGSSTSYANIPKIGASVALVGLNCPYMKTPHDLKHSLDELTLPYVAEIQRRQPTGPYYLGGWSAGGICAYDAVKHLIQKGEQVAGLLLLDSPFPIGLSKLPPRLYHFFNSIGLFGSGTKAPPEWLLPHFLAFVESLSRYEAQPLNPGSILRTHLIWAQDGVYQSTDARLEPQPDDTHEMTWLLNERTDFGPNGWDRLVGHDGLRIATLKGANHFSMMEGEPAKNLSEFIRSAME